MGNPNLRREVTRARSAYVGAVYELARAMTAFNEANVPLEPSPGGRLAPWTREHVTVVIACAEAWTDVVEKRRTYDRLLRDLWGSAARSHG